MGWVVVLAVLVLLGCTPLGVKLIFNVSGFTVDFTIGPVKKRVYPAPRTDKTSKEKAVAKKPSAEDHTHPKAEEKQGGALTDFMPLLQLATNFLGDFRRKLRVKRLDFLLVMAGDDPCDLAVNYGKAWAAVGGIMPQLERLFVIKKRDVQVCCDFTADKTALYLQAMVTITVGRLLGLLARYGIRACKEYFKIISKRKGGAIS